MNIEELAVSTSLDITGFLLPWASMLLSIIIALMIKDWATSFAKGLKFKMNREFNPGDVVILDSEEAVMVSKRIILNGNRLFFIEPLESSATETYI